MGMHVTLHGKNDTPANGADGTWQPVKVNAAGQLSIAMLNGELAQFNRLAAGPVAQYVNLTADGVVANAPCIVYGYIVTTIIGAGTVTVYDNASAASGTALFVIPAATAVGQYSFPVGVITTAGAYADFASTGTVNFLIAPSV
jgi:hypothetical protein